MWLEHLLFGACPKARRRLRECTRECKYFQSFLHTTAHPAVTDGRSLKCIFVDDKEGERRPTQRPCGREEGEVKPDAVSDKKTSKKSSLTILREKIKEVKKNRKRSLYRI